MQHFLEQIFKINKEGEKMDYDKEIEKLEGQLKGIETAYIKCMGTIEYLKSEKKKAEEGKKEKGK